MIPDFAFVFLTFIPAQSISLRSFGEIMRKLSCLLAIIASVGVLAISIRGPLAAADKPPVTLDEFFNSVEYNAARISPDGAAVVIQTTRSDWEANRYRTDLWLYRVAGANVSSGGTLIPLTQSGHEHSPQWSPDSRWIAFISDRAAQKSKSADGSDDADESEKSEPAEQLYVISVTGGESFQVTEGDESVHSFAWSADSRSIFFATKQPQSKEEKAAQKKEWKDVIRYRESERGDEIFSVDVAAVESAWHSGNLSPDLSAAKREISKITDSAKELTVSPDGARLAFCTDSRSEREETLDTFSIFAIELASAPHALAQPQLVSHAALIYDHIRWAKDSRHIFFIFLYGSVEGAYQDAQPRVYWVDAGAAPGGKPAGYRTQYSRWAANFTGAMGEFNVLSNGDLLAAGQLGTETQLYTQASPESAFTKQAGLPGTYAKVSTAAHSPRIAFEYSRFHQPNEIYIADSVNDLSSARPITSLNKLFTERAMPPAHSYQWTADDGTKLEGLLIYPPGKETAKNLPMFMLVHGGPEEADGDYFEADWYKWGALAATNGWLVFEPNYRGSTGYGDAFALGIIPHIVSRPGKDVLEGVDALVKEGIADPNHLAVGGYSYGGYVTNWVITQTTRFKAAVTGAGAVEHVVNWGNDDTVMDDAYFLGGRPWEAKENYNAEAAIWQIDKVTTPTFIVGGEDDVRVYVGEQYLLERGLFSRGIPVSLMIFPGEGHSLEKNPWHGKILVREDLKWLEKYAAH
jgi:dipeptidyl aminopeptidase/acylaminoacyl peptidase